MYASIKILTRSTLKTELPAFAMALVVAEFCYKLGSFTFEVVSFLATWYLFSFVLTKLVQFRPRL